MSEAPAVVAYVAVGANLGDARAAVQQAIEQLGRLPLTERLAASSLWRSAPVDAEGPDFINAVAAVRTRLGPHALLDELQAMERAAGRERPFLHAPRTLDLDLLRYGELTLQDARLNLPHARMHERAFVLKPLAEIAPAQVSADALARVAGQRIERL